MPSAQKPWQPQPRILCGRDAGSRSAKPSANQIQPYGLLDEDRAVVHAVAESSPNRDVGKPLGLASNREHRGLIASHRQVAVCV